MRIIKDNSGQSATELILLMASIFIIVLIVMNIYQDYILSMNNEIKNNELNNLLNKIDDINNYIK